MAKRKKYKGTNNDQNIHIIYPIYFAKWTNADQDPDAIVRQYSR
jgi:hypothetical protein